MNIRFSKDRMRIWLIWRILAIEDTADSCAHRDIVTTENTEATERTEGMESTASGIFSVLSVATRQRH